MFVLITSKSDRDTFSFDNIFVLVPLSCVSKIGRFTQRERQEVGRERNEIEKGKQRRKRERGKKKKGVTL